MQEEPSVAIRVAIYARVSTDDKGQDPENQLRQLREWCGRMGYPVVREYVEHENGGKGVEYRKRLDAMFKGASRREFDLLLVWSLDRFSREGMAATIGHLQRLASLGCRIPVIHGRTLLDRKRARQKHPP